MNLTPSIVMTSIASSLQVFKPYTHNELHIVLPKKVASHWVPMDLFHIENEFLG